MAQLGEHIRYKSHFYGATCPQCHGVGRKFPRSSHLANLGAATHDDLLLNAEARALFVGPHAREVTLEEKVDGGNIGISMEPGTDQLLFQKRAHYVNAATELQYAQLGQWAAEHAEALWQILREQYPWDDADSPLPAAGARTLFGEWCAYQHTVWYDRLPDLFLAFDVFDSTLDGGCGGFLSAARRDSLLHSTGIRQVRKVAHGRFASVQAVIAALQGTESLYCSRPTQIEGIYLRCDDVNSGTLLSRGKLVHPDFLQHIEEDGRWEKNSQKNGVRHDYWFDRDDQGKPIEQGEQQQEAVRGQQKLSLPSAAATALQTDLLTCKKLYSLLMRLNPSHHDDDTQHSRDRLLGRLASVATRVLAIAPAQPLACLCIGRIHQHQGGDLTAAAGFLRQGIATLEQRTAATHCSGENSPKPVESQLRRALAEVQQQLDCAATGAFPYNP